MERTTRGPSLEGVEHISVDEGMLCWRGRLSWKVYNPMKPIKYGIKSYILCDSATGYLYNMKPFCGESSTLQATVNFLLGDLQGHGYKLYMDNYYNSVALCEHLLGLKTHSIGPLHPGWCTTRYHSVDKYWEREGERERERERGEPEHRTCRFAYTYYR